MTDKETIEAIKEMEEGFGFSPMKLNEIDIYDYYDWLVMGYKYLLKENFIEVLR